MRPAPVLAILASLALSGCAHPWPREARGGMAERDPLPVGALTDLRSAIETQSASGAVGPAQTSIAAEHLLTAIRETDAGLGKDAEESLLEGSLAIGGADLSLASGQGPACLKKPCR